MKNFPVLVKPELITKERISAMLKKMRTDYKKDVDSGRKSGRGRVVFTFCNLCESLWGVLQQSRVLIQALILALPVFKINRLSLSLMKCPKKIMKKLILNLL